MRSRILLWITILWSTSIFGQLTPKGYDITHYNDSFIRSEWKPLLDAANDVRLVFGGENHREVDFNSLLEFQLMKMLYENCGYRNYLIELSPARAYYLNKFIHNGDKDAEKAIKGIASPKYMKLFDNLYRWNQQLPQEDRIYVHGIDVERFEDLSVWRLAQCFDSALKIHKPNTRILPEVVAYVDYSKREFKERLVYFNQRVNDTLSNDADEENDYEPPYYYSVHLPTFVDTLLDHMDWYNAWLDSTGLKKEFKAALEGVLEVARWEELEKTPGQYIWREGTMYSRLKGLLQQFPSEKFFGQFGRCHISLQPSNIDCGWYNYESVLNQTVEDFFGSRDSVVNIGYLYKGRTDDVHSENWEETPRIESEVNILKNKVSEGMVLYDLNSTEGSFQYLKSKFRFIVVNHAPVKSLANALISPDYEKKVVYEPVQVYLDYFGIEVFPNYQIPLEKTYEVVAKGQKLDMSRSLLGLRHGAHVGKGSWIAGIEGFYTLVDESRSEEAFWVDSVGKHFYTHWGLDLHLGLQNHSRRWNTQLMGRVGYMEPRIRYRAISKDPLNPAAVNEIDIINPSWNVGGAAQLGYQMADEVILFLRGSYYYNLSQTPWYYRGTSMPYAGEVSTQRNNEFWSLSAHVSIFISE